MKSRQRHVGRMNQRGVLFPGLRNSYLRKRVRKNDRESGSRPLSLAVVSVGVAPAAMIPGSAGFSILFLY